MLGPHTSVLGALARLGTHSGAFGPQTRAFNPHTRMLGPQTRPTTIVENHGDMDATGTVAVWALAPLDNNNNNHCLLCKGGYPLRILPLGTPEYDRKSSKS